MHEELFIQLQYAIENLRPDRIADAAPRGNAKSTIVSLALPLWCIAYVKKHYIIIVSDTSGQAEDFLLGIKSELEDNKLFIGDFGNQVGDSWTNSNIIVNGGKTRVQAIGAGKKIRGRRYKQWRPDLIIADDLENDENVQSPDQRVKMKNWHNKALASAGDERTDRVVIGTIIHYDSLLNSLINNPTYKTKLFRSIIKWSNSKLWDDWEKIITNFDDDERLKNAYQFYKDNENEMLDGTEVLWPEKEPYYDLMIQYISEGPAAFSSEKQNEPLSDDERRFHPDWIHYYDDDELKGKELYIVGYVDPSMGKHGGDYSAIITIASDYNYQAYVLDADIQKRHPDLIISDILSKHDIYHYKEFGVETNQFQEFFKDTFKKEIEDKKVDLNIREIKQHSDKILRIQSLQPDIKSGRVKFRRDQKKLITQLINFPSADHDDGPDALEGAIGLLGKRSAVADYYKEKADEANRQNSISFLQNASFQGFIK